ncbi:NEAT domain-containing protein [Cytobacillus purgationiresistens]|uniref:Heme uptake protein IsdC n=1 Tax=Cytobacillus purgationiresistens TaxID=863449 RepID=A0ABU0AMP6_9BACI|nr:NEAT domain-containing protein [Cytobacillus purgationiresistens]MDQ0272533.1 heme uptake protein IsdC [Cytobacillus purgationiresistens]
MKKQTYLHSGFIFILALLFFAVSSVLPASAQIADGTYSVSYSVVKPDSGSASMADGYFAKPATVKVKGGKLQVKLNTTSSMIKEFQVESGGSLKDVAVLATNGEQKTVQFTVDSISSPVNAKIHVIADASYDHWYSIRLAFNEGSMSAIQLDEPAKESGSATTGETGGSENKQTATNGSSNAGQVDNPETGDSTAMYALIAVLCGSSLILFRKIQVKRG